MTPPRAPHFEELCEVAERNGLAVEILGVPGRTAIWVFPPDPPAEATFGEVTATVRTAIVATPFWDASFDDASPQLIRMLAERGYR